MMMNCKIMHLHAAKGRFQNKWWWWWWCSDCEVVLRIIIDLWCTGAIHGPTTALLLQTPAGLTHDQHLIVRVVSALLEHSCKCHRLFFFSVVWGSRRMEDLSPTLSYPQLYELYDHCPQLLFTSLYDGLLNFHSPTHSDRRGGWSCHWIYCLIPL